MYLIKQVHSRADFSHQLFLVFTMSKSLNSVFSHIEAICKANGKNEDCYYIYNNILSGIINANHDIDDFDNDSIIEALDDIASKFSDDFYFEFDGNEYRVLHQDSIWNIYVETIKEIVKDCYDLKLDKFPDFIALSIDWEQTAQNAYADGYGHTFASYDGEEIETKQHHVFRVN
jgi:hypothetical protein